MSKCPYTNFRTKVIDWINILRTPREEYGGFAPCPFVGSEIDRDRLMIELFDPEKETIIDKIEKFHNSKYHSNVRSKAPYFLINIADRKVLSSAHNSLMKTAYFDKMGDEYKKYLKVKK